MMVTVRPLSLRVHCQYWPCSSGGSAVQRQFGLRQLVRRCREQGIVINQRAGRVRVSPHCYNNAEEIDRLVEILAAAGEN